MNTTHSRVDTLCREAYRLMLLMGAGGAGQLEWRGLVAELAAEQEQRQMLIEVQAALSDFDADRSGSSRLLDNVYGHTIQKQTRPRRI